MSIFVPIKRKKVICLVQWQSEIPLITPSDISSVLQLAHSHVTQMRNHREEKSFHSDWTFVFESHAASLLADEDSFISFAQ